MHSAVTLTLKNRATRVPIRFDEVVIRRKNAVDASLRKHYPHRVSRELVR